MSPFDLDLPAEALALELLAHPDEAQAVLFAFGFREPEHVLRNLGGLLEIEADGRSGGDGTVAARPGADVPEYHEGGRSALPALADIRAMGFLADGVKPLGLQKIVKLHVVGAPGHGHLEPLREPTLDRHVLSPNFSPLIPLTTRCVPIIPKSGQMKVL